MAEHESLSLIHLSLSASALKLVGQFVQNPVASNIYVAVQVSLSLIQLSLSASALKFVGQSVQKPVASKI